MARAARGSGRLEVALYNGIVVRADAISGSLRLKRDLILKLERAGVPIRAHVFSQATDAADATSVIVPSVHELWKREAFRRAQLHVFEFGIYYDLFDTVHTLAGRVVLTGVYHNVTPPSLIRSPEVRSVLEASLARRYNLLVCDRILCVSQLNSDDLLSLGAPAHCLDVLPLPPAITPAPRPPRAPSPVELLFVGRFLAAKGVLDLVRAVAKALRGGAPIRLTMVGNPQLSADDCATELQALIRDLGVGDAVRFRTALDDDALARLYAASDVVVVPSYHEGFCMPVVEGLASGCHVIAYAAGNLPAIVDSVGTLVPTGDVTALAAAIEALSAALVRIRAGSADVRLPLNSTESAEPEWRARVTDHLRAYSPQSYERGVIALLRWGAERAGLGAAAHALKEYEERHLEAVAA